MTEFNAARALFRTVGPNAGPLEPEDGFVVKNKRRKIYTCQKCGWETSVHWQMTMHNNFPTLECERAAAKRARKWSNW